MSEREVAQIEARCKALLCCCDDMCTGYKEDKHVQINGALRTDLPALIEDWKKMREALRRVVMKQIADGVYGGFDLDCEKMVEAMVTQAALTTESGRK